MSSKLKALAAAGLACAFVTVSPFALPMQAFAQFGGGSQYGSDSQGDSQGDPQMEIDRLSDQLRKLTGQNEELQYRNRQLEEQLRQLQGGAAPGAAGAPPARGPANAGAAPYQNQQYQNQPAQNPRYQQPQQPAYQGQQGAPITTPYNDGQTPSPGRRGDAFDPNQNPSAPGAPRALGSMQGQSNYAQPGAQPGAPMNIENNNYGSNSGVAAPQPNPGGGLTTAPPTRSPKDEFDLGLGYMQHKDYGLAEETMRNFTVKYPNDRLVGDAQYWLGESLYQRKKYREAAEAFLAVTSKYDKSAKAPDAMLRLGESLAALKEKDAACAAFGEVARKYPRASSGVKQGVARGQKRSGC